MNFKRIMGVLIGLGSIVVAGKYLQNRYEEDIFEDTEDICAKNEIKNNDSVKSQDGLDTTNVSIIEPEEKTTHEKEFHTEKESISNGIEERHNEAAFYAQDLMKNIMAGSGIDDIVAGTVEEVVYEEVEIEPNVEYTEEPKKEQSLKTEKDYENMMNIIDQL